MRTSSTLLKDPRAIVIFSLIILLDRTGTDQEKRKLAQNLSFFQSQVWYKKVEEKYSFLSNKYCQLPIHIKTHFPEARAIMHLWISQS